MIQYFNFGLTFLAAICLCVTLFYLWAHKYKEDERLLKGFNAFIFSLGFLEIYLLIKSFILFIEMFGWGWENLIYDLNLILNVGIIPLVVVLMLIGVLLFKEV